MNREKWLNILLATRSSAVGGFVLRKFFRDIFPNIIPAKAHSVIDYAHVGGNLVAAAIMRKNNPAAAIADFQKYLDLGGGERDGDTEEVEQMIRELRQDYSL